MRGIHGALSTLAQFAGEADELVRLRDILLPDGLDHTRKTYRGQAGHAALVASRLDAAFRARLKAVTLHDKNLLDLVDEWLTVSKKLGDLEEERARLGAPATTGSAQINAARMAWVRVANAMLANAELAAIDPDDDRVLFSGLRAAERRADGRTRSRRAEPNAPEAPSTPDPAAPPTPGSPIEPAPTEPAAPEPAPAKPTPAEPAPTAETTQS